MIKMDRCQNLIDSDFKGIYTVAQAQCTVESAAKNSNATT